MKVVLLSGGMDSAALAWWLQPDACIFIDYGQKAARSERRAARAIARSLGITLESIKADCSAVGSGSMAGGIQGKLAPTPEWWPFRNQLLLTLAAAKFAANREVLLFLGSVVGDRKNGDGTPEFIKAINTVFSVQPGNVKIRAPASGYSAIQLINKSKVPIDLLRLSYSCHKGNSPCGTCRGCAKQGRVWGMLSKLRSTMTKRAKVIL